MESRDGWRRDCWRVVSGSDFSSASGWQETLLGTTNDSYASGLIAEPVLLLAKLRYEEKAVRVKGIGRGGLLCKSTS